MNGRITIRLDREQQTALGLLARRHSHSVGAEVRQALRRWIEDAPRRAEAARISRMSDAERRAYLAGVDDELERHLADADPALATQVRNDERSGSVRSAIPTPPIGATDHARSG